MRIFSLLKHKLHHKTSMVKASQALPMMLVCSSTPMTQCWLGCRYLKLNFNPKHYFGNKPFSIFSCSQMEQLNMNKLGGNSVSFSGRHVLNHREGQIPLHHLYHYLYEPTQKRLVLGCCTDSDSKMSTKTSLQVGGVGGWEGQRPHNFQQGFISPVSHSLPLWGLSSSCWRNPLNQQQVMVKLPAQPPTHTAGGGAVR